MAVSRRRPGFVRSVLLPAMALVAGVAAAGACSSTGPSAAGSSATQTVTDQGAVLRLDDVVLEIPPGALAVPQPITISKTTEPPPAGYEASSAIYRFEPDGLVFAKPASLSLGSPAAASGTSIIWSQGAVAFEPLVTSFADGRARASIVHFSRGFLGTPACQHAQSCAVGADAASDASATDAAGDASDVDAGACLGPTKIDPTQYPDSTANVTFPFSSFGCPISLGTPSTKPSARVIEFTKTVNLTMWENHALSLKSGASSSQLRTGCDGTGPVVATHPSYDCRTSFVQLTPDRYTFIACDVLGQFFAEPPPVAANANTSCATASTSLFATSRVYDATKLYFKFTPLQSKTYLLSVKGGISVGAFGITIQGTCDDGTTDVLNIGPGNGGIASGANLCLSGNTGGYETSVALTGGKTYWIVLSSIDPGLKPSLSFQ